VGLDPVDTTKNFLDVSGRDFPLPPGADEVLLAITGPFGQPLQIACPVFPVQTTRLVSVSGGT
jgi:hypothetical protein